MDKRGWGFGERRLFTPPGLFLQLNSYLSRMKRNLIISILFFGIAFCGFSQNPVEWKFSAKKIAEKLYEIHLAAIVQNPWHIYSQFTPEGGPIATSIQFNKNPLIEIEGTAKEIGKLQQKHEEVFGVDVKYFGGNIDFVQIIKIKGKGNPSTPRTNISGTIEYMICNDQECLPPKTVAFNVRLE